MVIFGTALTPDPRSPSPDKLTSGRRLRTTPGCYPDYALVFVGDQAWGGVGDFADVALFGVDDVYLRLLTGFAVTCGEGRGFADVFLGGLVGAAAQHYVRAGYAARVEPDVLGRGQSEGEGVVLA